MPELSRKGDAGDSVDDANMSRNLPQPTEDGTCTVAQEEPGGDVSKDDEELELVEVGNYEVGWDSDSEVVYHEGFPKGHYVGRLSSLAPWKHFDS